MAKRVISRITDSVNCSVFAESSGLMFVVSGDFDGFLLLGTVKLAINYRVARDDLHILARLGAQDRIHKVGKVADRVPRGPQGDAVFTGMVPGSPEFDTPQSILHAPSTNGPEPFAEIRVEN